jgi:hypothetical protein
MHPLGAEKSRTRSSLALACTIALLAFVGFSMPIWEQDALAASLTLHTPFSASAECDIDCGGSGTYCDADEHDAWDTTPAFYRWTRNGGVHAFPEDCRPGTCDTTHGPSCLTGAPVEYEHFDALRQSLLTGDVPALTDLVTSSARITVNRKRSAIQVLNCQGAVVMHLPAAQRIIDAMSSDVGLNK